MVAPIGQDLDKALHLLESGELVAIPTETVYGLAANALNGRAVAKIFEAKNRPSFDPLIVHVASMQHARKFAIEFPLQAEALARRFWPGPLTLLLPKTSEIPDLVTAGLDRVGLRCPAHPLTISLLAHASFPLAAPSANPFGYISPTTAHHVQDQLGNKVSYIIDGGPSRVGIESTIVGWEHNEPVIYRLGGISTELIEAVVGAVLVKPHSTSHPQAPGQLTSHYAPRKPFLLGDLMSLAAAHPHKRLGVLSWKGFDRMPGSVQMVLSPNGDLTEAAHHLFSMMRTLDESPVELVIAEEVPNQGLGRAINDRLRRAAAKV
ncbi:MAG TPA: L-threonylcarbamoyladenylate synthase [Cyclobacteriaceae bacterium]|nr:L-threonylcarbamoyladenylate synthase [Cyclobacteriaceae bacterium]